MAVDFLNIRTMEQETIGIFSAGTVKQSFADSYCGTMINIHGVVSKDMLVN